MLLGSFPEFVGWELFLKEMVHDVCGGPWNRSSTAGIQIVTQYRAYQKPGSRSANVDPAF
jgi:hypothetical protein